MTRPAAPMSSSPSGLEQWVKRSPLASLWERLEALPRPQPEESIPLRILVQAMVTVGILATDVAAADVAAPLWISLWAIPASIVGAGWSWRQRRRKNTATQFSIALAMLVALALFLSNIVRGQVDTRLALAELLIHLQVLHSFDLPRRKDLGYSMVIGLILIGVAGTISQTLAFAPLLILFLAISLPVLVLDYRSRLGLETRRLQRPQVKGSVRRWLTLGLVVVGLGLTIFAFLPRFPGYQLRTFPVSSPIQFEGQFDGQTIINPGYVREGLGQNGSGIGNGAGLDGPGELDSTFYYGFNTRMNQNLRGSMESQVVLRVRAQAPGFWRVLAFDHYTGQGWEVSRNGDEDIQVLRRPSWTYRFLMPPTNRVSSAYSREVVQSYTVVSELPNLIPALYSPREVYFPTREIAIDPEQGLRSPVGLGEGLTYTVVSDVPYRDRTRLQQASTDYPNRIRNVYLEIPEAIAPQLRDLTQDILDRAPSPITAPYEQALYLAQYLKQTYTIQPDLPFLAEDEDLADAFLFTHQGGYPDHFSTVLTLMLRSIGVPARLTVGFSPGEFNPFTGFYVVRNTDAHAITEIYTEYGWFGFNPIPGYELLPPSIEQTETFSVLQQLWQWVAGWLPSPVTGFVNQVMDAIAGIFNRIIGFFSALLSQGWLGALLTLLIVTGLGFLGWLTWAGLRAWHYQRWLRGLPPMEAQYQRMLYLLANQGYPKSPAQTPLEYATQAHTYHPAPRAEAIQAISEAYVRWRYGGHAPNLSQVRGWLTVLQPQRKRSRLPYGSDRACPPDAPC
jgi:transglutaminase-like putative cysteine protease